MRCPKCGHIMEPHRKGFRRDNNAPFWKCADILHCGHKIPWDKKRDGEYTEMG